jgi:two-component system sensor histidine kinase/response regulator
MKSDSDIHRRTRRTYWIISLVFGFLGVSLHILTLLYWERVLEPQLRSNAQSQANILAHSQSVKLADVLILDKLDKRLPALRETVDEVLLFSDPDTKTPFFLGLDLDLDYEVVAAPVGSLNITQGEKSCQDCFLSTVALYSPISDELIGIALFRVSNSFFQDILYLHTLLCLALFYSSYDASKISGLQG